MSRNVRGSLGRSAASRACPLNPWRQTALELVWLTPLEPYWSKALSFADSPDTKLSPDQTSQWRPAVLDTSSRVPCSPRPRRARVPRRRQLPTAWVNTRLSENHAAKGVGQQHRESLLLSQDALRLLHCGSGWVKRRRSASQLSLLHPATRLLRPRACSQGAWLRWSIPRSCAACLTISSLAADPSNQVLSG